MKTRLFTLIFIAFLFSIKGNGQQLSTLQHWFDYTQVNRINENWSYIGDYAFRFQIEDPESKWWLIQGRPSVIFKKKALYDLRGGIMLRFTRNTEGNEFEFRPWQGSKVYWPNFGRFRFVNYFRAEQRFSVELETNESNFVFKLRYKLSTSIPINNPIITSKTFYGVIGYELFFDLGGGENNEFIDDVTRFDVGIGYQFNTKTHLRLIYIFQKSRVNLEETDDSNDHIISITVVQKFGLK